MFSALANIEGYGLRSSRVKVYRYPYGLLRGTAHALITFPMLVLVPVLVVLPLFLFVDFLTSLQDGNADHLGVPIYGKFLLTLLVVVPVCGIATTKIVREFAGSWMGALRHASIVLDYVGVSSRIAGISARHIPWKDVEKITKRRLFYSGKGYAGYRDDFTVESRTQKGPKWLLINLLGNISFGEAIEDQEGLIRQLNIYAKRYQIPQFYFNKESSEDMACPYTKYEPVDAF